MIDHDPEDHDLDAAVRLFVICFAFIAGYIYGTLKTLDTGGPPVPHVSRSP